LLALEIHRDRPQFDYKAPAGFYTFSGTAPDGRFLYECPAGYYCLDGTKALNRFRVRC
jgi:hypothetical protein